MTLGPASSGTPPLTPEGEAFRRAMRHLPTGVAVLTTRGPGGPHGMTVNSVLSVSLAPPTLLVAVGHRTRTHGLLARADSYTVNVLGADQGDLADRFARSRPEGEAEFEGLAWTPSPVTGNPVLAGSVVAVDCRIGERVRVADHTLFLGAVRHVRSAPDGTGCPLVFVHRAYRRVATEPAA
ncbi:flavin reductase family protein [Saccharothrix australiensis]|uniref:Flavin reductase (DIM6/NTAB) family NADH-FMN oxidoreductase RutF n=1 Tax=Saccharothrix australiensis TaxID=2072 RepID=A0A495VYG1_9PSEU|nr:flavin reductase family protein [Saccharothrix australiensis]RKT54289.1 flavin reductase (DIM6/NTAB) family NADH-FMN oxidoreductase RutF [Saccharothrix australiensis]